MNVYRVQETWGAIVVLALGLILAGTFGHLAGSGQFLPLFAIIGVLLAIVIFALLEFRVFLLIPIFWGVQVGVVSSTIPLGFQDIAILLGVGAFIGCVALKIIRAKPVWESIDLWILVMLAYLVLTFFRNPVGLNVLGSDRVGGKPYFTVFEAAAVYYMLCRVSCTAGEARWLPAFMILGHCIEPAFGLVSYLVPSTAPFVGKLYGADSMSGDNPIIDSQDPTLPRLAFLGPGGAQFVQGAASYFDPRSLINPFFIGRFCLLVTGLVMVFLSGYRTILIDALLLFMVSSYVRHGITEVVRFAIVATVLFGIMILAQGKLFNLPPAAQRVLSFLPGHWDYDVVSEAEGSSQWRFQMWEIALTTDQYIHDKILGDGFGFTRAEFERVQAYSASQTPEEGQEVFMLNGNFHSGPVTTLRVVGCVGGVLFYCFMIALAIASWKVIRRAQGTPFFALALYIGIPLVILPFGFTFIFGAFSDDMPRALFGAGMVKFISRSLDNYQATLKTKPTEEKIPAKAEVPKYVIA